MFYVYIQVFYSRFFIFYQSLANDLQLSNNRSVTTKCLTLLKEVSAILNIFITTMRNITTVQHLMSIKIGIIQNRFFQKKNKKIYKFLKIIENNSTFLIINFKN